MGKFIPSMYVSPNRGWSPGNQSCLLKYLLPLRTFHISCVLYVRLSSNLDKWLHSYLCAKNWISEPTEFLRLFTPLFSKSTGGLQVSSLMKRAKLGFFNALSNPVILPFHNMRYRFTGSDCSHQLCPQVRNYHIITSSTVTLINP